MSLRNGTKYETECKKLLEQYSTVLNLSPSEPGDLIVPELMQIHEVKSVRGDAFHLSHPKEREQLRKLIELCTNIGYALYYDVKFLGRGWRSFLITGPFTALTVKGEIRHKRSGKGGDK